MIEPTSQRRFVTHQIEGGAASMARLPSAVADPVAPLDFLRVVVLNDCSPLFDVWLVIGALLAPWCRPKGRPSQ
jgi:hypothetical protein